MADKYQNKYRIPSARLKNWDYRNNGAYFITICTKNMQHFFGKVENGKMQLSEIGKIAHKYWAEIPQHFPFIQLDAFIIMPNHTHGILIMNKMNDQNDGNPNPVQTLHCNVSSNADGNSNIDGIADGNANDGNQMRKISPKSGSISTIIRSYKSATTKMARKINAHFEWQTRFHDHIIRNQKSFTHIHHYILNNPKNWGNDKFSKS